MRSFERRSWKAPAICLRVEIALIPHDVLEIGELAFVDEERELAGLGEIDLGREQRDRVQQSVARRREPSLPRRSTAACRRGSSRPR